MGIMTHHAMIVTSWDEVYALAAHAEACSIFGADQISPLLRAPVNCYHSFLVSTDGSKAGWDASDEGDARRDRFVEWLDGKRYSDRSSSLDWVEVEYGECVRGEHDGAKVTRHGYWKGEDRIAVPRTASVNSAGKVKS